jgi:hypothetical protein
MRATIALVLILFGIFSEARGQQTPLPEKPTQIQFDQADAARVAAPEKTKERAEAAKKAMKMAYGHGMASFRRR